MAQPVAGNRYRILDLLGTGGMGTVYRAYDRLTGQTVALKHVVLVEGAKSQETSPYRHTEGELRMALAREFQTLASLRHPHMIAVLDYGFDTQREPYFTMPLLEGAQDIRHVAARRDVPGKIDLLIQMLQALAYLHRRGVIHRDLKPSNVLVDAQGQVKVLDLGLAAEAGKTHATAGTLAYMAPEVLQEQPANVTSDLYSFGIMAYELLAGTHPFDLARASDLISAILHRQPDLERLQRSIGESLKTLNPPLLAAIIGKLVSKDPTDRYQDAYHVIEDLSAAIQRPVPEESPAIRESFLQASRFVGRDEEMARLSRALDEAMLGDGSAWLVGGESGVGKSRLVDELRIRALVRGAVVLRGQAVEGGGLPFHAWHSVARRLALMVEVSDLEASILKTIVPDIGTLLERDVPDAPELSGEAAQQRIVFTLIDLFKRLREPSLLILEDLQWAGESLMPLKRLAPLAQTLPLMIVANYRDDEAPDLPDQLPDMQVMTLSRLSPDAISALAVSMLGATGEAPEMQGFLARETEGNVFFLVEVVRAMAEEAGRLSNIGRQTLPKQVFAGGVQQVVRRRLSRVPQWGQELLKLAAIAGRQLDRRVLQQLATVDLERWITECANAAVLEAYEGGWRFAHDKLRETLLNDIAGDERPTLYRRVAEAIERAYPNRKGRSGQLAALWQVVGDVAKEQAYREATGNEAYELGRFIDATHTYERALALLPDEAVEHRIDLLVKLGIAYLDTFMFRSAQEKLELALELARASGNMGGVARALSELSFVADRLGEFDIAKERLAESISLARAIGDPRVLARVLWVLGMHLVFTCGVVENANEYFEECLTLAKQLGDSEKIISTLNGLGVTAYIANDFVTARGWFEKGMEVAQEVGNRTRYAQILNNIAELDCLEGRYEQAYEGFLECLRIETAYGSLSATIIYANVSRTASWIGKLDEARRYAREGLELAWRLNATPYAVMGLVPYAEIATSEGNPALAAALLGFVLNHPSVDANGRIDSNAALKRLRERYPHMDIDAGLEAGKSLDLETVVRGMLGQSSNE